MPPERRKVKIKAWIDDIVNKDVKDLNVIALYDSDGVVIPIEMLSMLGLSLGSGNEILVGSSATAGPTFTETNSAQLPLIYSYVLRSAIGSFENSRASGSMISTTSGQWTPIPSTVGASTVITADANGNIGAAADVLAAVAAKLLDCWFICQVDTTGSYTTKWCEDPTGTPALTDPDYHTAGHISYLVAGYPYMLRVETVTAAKAFGFDAGVNGNWPNNANMYITGFYRTI